MTPKTFLLWTRALYCWERWDQRQSYDVFNHSRITKMIREKIYVYQLPSHCSVIPSDTELRSTSKMVTQPGVLIMQTPPHLMVPYFCAAFEKNPTDNSVIQFAELKSSFHGIYPDNHDKRTRAPLRLMDKVNTLYDNRSAQTFPTFFIDAPPPPPPLYRVREKVGKFGYNKKLLSVNAPALFFFFSKNTTHQKRKSILFMIHIRLTMFSIMSLNKAIGKYIRVKRTFHGIDSTCFSYDLQGS